MANVNPPLKNQAYSFDIALKDFSTPGALKANPTLAAGDFLLYIDNVLSTLGAAGSGNLISLPTIVGATVVVSISLTAAEMNGDKITVTAIDQTSPMQWEQALYTINTTAAVSSAPSAATVAAAVWDLDATAHQTGGTFGQAIGDPGANTETLYKAIVTDSAGTNIAADVIAIQADTDDIQSRIPSALVGGRIDASVGAMAASVLAAAGINADLDVYQVDIGLEKDTLGARNVWSAVWRKNGATLIAGITNPDIWVYDDAGNDLIGTSGAPGAMTQVGTTGTFIYVAITTEMITAGKTYFARVRATIAAVTRTGIDTFSRDD